MQEVSHGISPVKVRNICCIGAGYVGGPTSAVIANQNPNIIVHVVDKDADRIAAWNSDELPIKEPALLPLVQTARDASDGRSVPNLKFSLQIRQAIEDADIIFVAVNTPLKTTARGAGQALDIVYVESAVESIARYAKSNKIVVEKSTVPCGTSNFVKEMLENIGQPDVSFDVLSNPEFLAEGTAIHNLLHPDRVLIGSERTNRGRAAASSLRQVYSWVPEERVLFMNVRSAELAKLTSNAMLAQRMSSINAISAICEESGADVEEIAFACGLDPRIGPHMLKASLGFGGSCLGKDVATLAHYSSMLGLDHVASYWASINQINQLQKSRFADRILRLMNNTVAGKKIAILGCAFKKNTADIRESAAVSLLAVLLGERCHLSIYDPQVSYSSLLTQLNRMTPFDYTELRQAVTMYKSVYSASREASAIVIATDWDEFNNAIDPPFVDPVKKETEVRTTRMVDWTKIYASMQYPKLVFDGRNVVDGVKLAKLGFKVHQIGRAAIID